MAAFFSYIHRLLSISMSSENYSSELNWIRQVTYNNHYNLIIIDTLIEKIEYKKAIQQVFLLSAMDDKVFHVITYYRKITEKILQHLKKYDVHLAYKSNKSLQILFKNSK